MRKLESILSGALLLAGSVATAAPTACPLDGAQSECTVLVGGTQVEIDASSIGSGALEVFDWIIDGTAQLYIEAFEFRTLGPLAVMPLTLQSATVDAATRTVVASYIETGMGRAGVTATFVISDDGYRSRIGETIVVHAFAPVSFRLYTVHDFNLAGTSTDGTAVANANGTLITQVGGATTATVEVIAGSAPNAVEVARCCDLEDIYMSDLSPTLNGALTATPDGDLEAATSWDRTLATGQEFALTLRKTITTPEPSEAAEGAAAFFGFVALARRDARTRRAA